MKGIIIGAGSGKRIGKFAQNTPKSLLDVNSKTILENQIELFKKNDIKEIIVITGPNKEMFKSKEVTYVYDSLYEKHDILGSLMMARNHLFGDVVITYSDIMFDESILHQVIRFNQDIGIAIDLDWEKAYSGRTEHPKTEAENVLLDVENKIIEIRKNIQHSDNRIAEFLGILKLSEKGSQTFVKKYEELEQMHKGKFHTAPSVQKAYLTDIIQELINSGIDVAPIIISGKWCEIDTSEDLLRAKKLFQ